MPGKPGKNREQLKEITDRIEAGIRDIFESGDMEKYRNYLRTMSRFHNYSLNNQALIHLQRPDATLVAGYNRWQVLPPCAAGREGHHHHRAHAV